MPLRLRKIALRIPRHEGIRNPLLQASSDREGQRRRRLHGHDVADTDAGVVQHILAAEHQVWWKEWDVFNRAEKITNSGKSKSGAERAHKNLCAKSTKWQTLPTGQFRGSWLCLSGFERHG